MIDPLKKHIDINRNDFETKVPPKLLWEKIKNNIPNIDQNPSEIKVETEVIKRFRIQPIYYGVAASVLVFVMIYFGFNQSNSEQNSFQNTVVKSSTIEKNISNETILKVLNNNEKYIAINTEDKTNENNVLVNNLIVDTMQFYHQKYAKYLIGDSISVSNRIKGIALMDESKKISQDDLSLLKNLSLNDSNSVVRLNALEVLCKNLNKDKLADELTSIFLEQNDAMVQLELINIIRTIDPVMHDQQLIHKLQQIILDTKSSSFLKDEAYVVLLEKNIL